jgi:signal transduction histidine kinase
MRAAAILRLPEEQDMKIKLLAATVTASCLFVGAATAAEFGTSAEAKAMLDKAAAAVKADKADALAKFNKGEGGFKDRDLYPFCAGADGNFTAHPALLGKSMKELKDKTGKAMGEEMIKVAAEGKVAEVSYMWPRPGATEPVQKVSYITKIGDQVCGVGYYK